MFSIAMLFVKQWLYACFLLLIVDMRLLMSLQNAMQIAVVNSCDELSHLCHGQGFTDEDIQSIICKCDTDEDGNISKEEFMAAM